MHPGRLLRAAGAALVLAVGVGAAVKAFIARAPDPSSSIAALPRLEAGHRFIDSLRQRAAAAAEPAAVSLEEAVALGYAERLRLALGGPFRLADHALRDPRLSAPARVATAWALLDAARQGTAHVVDPMALATVIPDRMGPAVHHLALIEREVGRGDPRAGELAVRLAYELAAAEQLIKLDAIQVLAQAAAIVRDREIARHDVDRLLQAAAVEGRQPLALIAEWRAARRFASERPATEAQDPAIEREALSRVAPLLDSVRVLVAEGQRGDRSRDPKPVYGRRPFLPPAAAERLAQESGFLPPQGPVVVAMRTHTELLAAAMPRTTASRKWIDGLPSRVTHDEALAAEHARIVWNRVHSGAVARATLAAAVGMRAYAQEFPWFPGDPGPTTEELRRGYGFADVRFAGDVPAAWRPYFRRMIASATTDLRRVVPTARFDGLHVRVEMSPATAPLAVHDPATRTLRLPATTAAGVLAHELAHDLDWQAARRLYARRSGYSTDYAVRARRDRVAESVQGLTSARLVPPTAENGYRPPHDLRPAEVFARNFDWFVAVSLAREGRVNGYLTAVQDELLTGYATVSASEADGRGAESLMRLLGDVAFVSAPVRNWFLEQWGPTRTLRSYALVRELIATPAPSSMGAEVPLFAVPVFRAVPAGRATRAAVGRTSDAYCADGRGVASAERPQVALAWLAADARARGLVRAAATEMPADARPAWALSALGVAPWSPEIAGHATRQVRDGLLQGLAARASLDSPFTAPGC